MLQLIPIHADMSEELKSNFKDQCVAILNEEWPRSETLRYRTLNSSKESFPMCIALVKTPENVVIGHVKLSQIPSAGQAIWIESVVIHPDVRGKGIGKYLMLKTEEFCKAKGFNIAYLCTIDKQVFYSRCGYKFCKPVTASSGTVGIRQGMFDGQSHMDSLMKKNKDDDLLPKREDELGTLCATVFQANPSLGQEPCIKLPLRTLPRFVSSVKIDKSQINPMATSCPATSRLLLQSSRLWMRSSMRYCSSSTKFSDLYQDLMIKVVSEKSKIPESQIEPRLNAMMASRVNKLESSQMQNFIKILSRDPANHYVWVKACDNRIELLNQDISILEEIRDIFLIDFEVSKKKFTQILQVLPEDFFQREKLLPLRQSLTSLFGFCKVKKLNAVEIIIKMPALLLYDHQLLEERFLALRDYFGTKNEISDLVTNSPSVLLQDWTPLQRKLEFLIHEMQVFPGTLAKSKVLNYDLLMIKDRYEFLLRTGLYQHPSLKSLGPKAEAKPPIKEIAETKLETFIDEVVGHGFTVEDYNLFKKMLDEEFDRKEENLWYIENGFEDEDFISDLQQREEDQRGYKPE